MRTAWDTIAPSLSEADFLKDVRTAATDLGYLVYHTRTSIGSPPGFPDLVLVRAASPSRHGRVIFVELKAERERLKPDQRHWCDTLRRAGAEVYAPLKPSDYDAFLLTLVAARRPEPEARQPEARQPEARPCCGCGL